GDGVRGELPGTVVDAELSQLPGEREGIRFGEHMHGRVLERLAGGIDDGQLWIECGAAVDDEGGGAAAQGQEVTEVRICRDPGRPPDPGDGAVARLHEGDDEGSHPAHYCSSSSRTMAMREWAAGAMVRRSSLRSDSSSVTQPLVPESWSRWSQMPPPLAHPIGRVVSVGGFPGTRL